ncbi:MAG TPA: crossover junction endodeoxyribonuclease RuvC [Bacteroidia bacterium]|nr:crossover junction endodeoxyribonuclease RuvC [Bacteroidia bacterium]
MPVQLPADNRNQKDKVILGIDPGTNIMGFGVIHILNRKMQMRDLGVIRMEKIGDPAGKLKAIFENTLALVDKHLPDEFAIESPFFGKNVQSMLKLGRAQGVAIAAALIRNIPVFEYSPKKIKMSITGNGNASKEQVAIMLQQLLILQELPDFLDATDGLATAVCHHFQNGQAGGNGKKYGSWNSFLTANSERQLTSSRKPKKN